MRAQRDGESGPQQLEEPSQRIDLDDAYQVRYWTSELVVTEQELRKAVELVGTDVADVRRALVRPEVSQPVKGTKPGP
jgi:hypothetical protein